MLWGYNYLSAYGVCPEWNCFCKDQRKLRNDKLISQLYLLQRREIELA